MAGFSCYKLVTKARDDSVLTYHRGTEGLAIRIFVRKY